MKYTVLSSFIDVVGQGWMCPTIAIRIELNSHQLESIREWIEILESPRDGVERWLLTNAGDFSQIEDFSADLEIEGQGKNIVIPWMSEENGYIWGDIMNPDLD